MTTIIIATMWIVTIALMFGFLYLVGTVGFWCFAKVWGIYDQYMQERYWRKRGFLRTMSQDGQDWYINFDKD